MAKTCKTSLPETRATLGTEITCESCVIILKQHRGVKKSRVASVVHNSLSLYLPLINLSSDKLHLGWLDTNQDTLSLAALLFESPAEHIL